MLEALAQVRLLLMNVNIPYAGALVYLPDVAAAPPGTLITQTSPRHELFTSPPSSSLRPPSPLPQGDRRTGTQTPETRGSAAGRRNSGPVQFYCYLPKRANYIWSLRWDLFCRLSVNKLCGSSQAAYLTFSGPSPHTSSSTFTRAGSCGAFRAAGTSQRLNRPSASRSALEALTGPSPLYMRPLPQRPHPAL